MKKDGIQTRKRKPKNPMNVLQSNPTMKGDIKGTFFYIINLFLFTSKH